MQKSWLTWLFLEHSRLPDKLSFDKGVGGRLGVQIISKELCEDGPCKLTGLSIDRGPALGTALSWDDPNNSSLASTFGTLLPGHLLEDLVQYVAIQVMPLHVLGWSSWGSQKEACPCPRQWWKTRHQILPEEGVARCCAASGTPCGS